MVFRVGIFKERKTYDERKDAFCISALLAKRNLRPFLKFLKRLWSKMFRIIKSFLLLIRFCWRYFNVIWIRAIWRDSSESRLRHHKLAILWCRSTNSLFIHSYCVPFPKKTRYFYVQKRQTYFHFLLQNRKQNFFICKNVR